MSMRLTLGTTLAGLPISEFNLAFLKPDFEILTFFPMHLIFFENENSQIPAFFQSERLCSGKTLSELHIHYKSPLMRG